MEPDLNGRSVVGSAETCNILMTSIGKFDWKLASAESKTAAFDKLRIFIGIGFKIHPRQR